MSVTVNIPNVGGSLSATLTGIDRVGEMVLVDNYLYLFTNTTSPGKVVKVLKTDFAQRTSLTLPDDVGHIEVYDALYSSTNSKLYALYPHSIGYTITEINPSTMTSTDVVIESGGAGFTHASMCADETYLYVLHQPDTIAVISRYALSNFAKTDLELVGYRNPTCIRASGGAIYVAGTRTAVSATTSWLLKVSPTSYSVTANTSFTHGGSIHTAGTDTLGFSADAIFFGYRDSTGRVQRILKSDFSVSTIETDVTAPSVSLTENAPFVWVLFNNGIAIRIHTETIIQQSYSLATNYITELVADNQYIYAATYTAPTTLYRYDISPRQGALIWVHTPGTSLNDQASCSAVDTGGNVVTIGALNGYIFLNKYTAGGALIWSKVFGTGFGYGVATDASDNIYITGAYLGAGAFGGAILPGQGYSDVFVAKFTADGTHVWSKGFVGPAEDQGSAIAIDPSGNIIVTGFYYSNLTVNGTILTSSGSDRTIFLIKLSAADGSNVWAKTFGGTQDSGAGVATGPDDIIYLTGRFASSIDFGNGVTASGAGLQAFVTKFNSSGVAQWAKQFGGSLLDSGNAIASFANGDVVVTGEFMGTADFGFGNVTSTGQRDIFILKLNSSGTSLWVKTAGGSLQFNDFGYAVTVDRNQNVIAGGTVTGDTDFGGGTLVAPGPGNDCYMVKFTSAGSFIWNKAFGNYSQDRILHLTTDLSGNIIASGSVSGPVDFGHGPHNWAGGSDAFVAKFSP